MVQSTTPTFILTLPDSVDLTLPAHIYFTLKQGNVYIEKDDSRLTVDGHNISVSLTQAEAARLDVGRARIQLNLTYNNGARAASEIVSVDVTENLLRGVLV